MKVAKRDPMGYPVAVTQEVTLCMEKETVKRIFLFFKRSISGLSIATFSSLFVNLC